VAEPSLPQIDIATQSDLWDSPGEYMGWIRSAIESATATGELNFPQDSELSIVLTDDRSIRELNKFWRQIDKPTKIGRASCRERV